MIIFASSSHSISMQRTAKYFANAIRAENTKPFVNVNSTCTLIGHKRPAMLITDRSIITHFSISENALNKYATPIHWHAHTQCSFDGYH